MRCLMCYTEMTLVTVIRDDTMPVAGFEHHTFMCSRCGDVERRLIFAKPAPNGDLASPAIAPDATAPGEREFRRADAGRFRDVLARILGRPH